MRGESWVETRLFSLSISLYKNLKTLFFLPSPYLVLKPKSLKGPSLIFLSLLRHDEQEEEKEFLPGISYRDKFRASTYANLTSPFNSELALTIWIFLRGVVRGIHGKTRHLALFFFFFFSVCFFCLLDFSWNIVVIPTSYRKYVNFPDRFVRHY